MSSAPCGPLWAIDELTTAVDEAVITARDSAKDISEIAKALKDTAAQVEEHVK